MKNSDFRVGVINWDSGLKSDTYFGYHTANTLGKAEFKDRVPYYATRVPWIVYKDVDYANIPNGDEIFEQGKRFCEYVRENKREDDPNHMLAFAWNEFEEGGWLCPTLSDNGADASRLQGFKKAVDYFKKNL